MQRGADKLLDVGLRVGLEFRIEAAKNVCFADIVVENSVEQILLVLEITGKSTRNIDLIEKRLEYDKKGIRTHVVADCFGNNGYS